MRTSAAGHLPFRLLRLFARQAARNVQHGPQRMRRFKVGRRASAPILGVVPRALTGSRTAIKVSHVAAWRATRRGGTKAPGRVARIIEAEQISRPSCAGVRPACAASGRAPNRLFHNAAVRGGCLTRSKTLVSQLYVSFQVLCQSLILGLARKKGSGNISRNGPSVASHFWCLRLFPNACPTPHS